MKAFIAAVICAAAIGVGGVLCPPYATGDGRRRIFDKRRARRRPRTQSRRDELEPSVYSRQGMAPTHESAGRSFTAARLELFTAGPS